MKTCRTAIGLGVALAGALVWNGYSPVWAASPALATSHTRQVDGPAIVKTALGYLDASYVDRGMQPATGFDDVGFVRWVYAQQGVDLPLRLSRLRTTAHDIHAVGLRPGYLIFFKNIVRLGLSHVGIYIGHGQFVHAEWYGRGVVTSYPVKDSVDGSYWANHYTGTLKPSEVPSGPGYPPLPSLSAGDSVVVTVTSLNLRSGPTFSSPVLSVLPQGPHLTVIASRGKWVHVQGADSRTGWVIRQDVSIRLRDCRPVDRQFT